MIEEAIDVFIRLRVWLVSLSVQELFSTEVTCLLDRCVAESEIIVIGDCISGICWISTDYMFSGFRISQWMLADVLAKLA